jgi:hypothetical protein
MVEYAAEKKPAAPQPDPWDIKRRSPATAIEYGVDGAVGPELAGPGLIDLLRKRSPATAIEYGVDAPVVPDVAQWGTMDDKR